MVGGRAIGGFYVPRARKGISGIYSRFVIGSKRIKYICFIKENMN
jgi:hypothetical protein